MKTILCILALLVLTATTADAYVRRTVGGGHVVRGAGAYSGRYAGGRYAGRYYGRGYYGNPAAAGAAVAAGAIAAGAAAAGAATGWGWNQPYYYGGGYHPYYGGAYGAYPSSDWQYGPSGICSPSSPC